MYRATSYQPGWAGARYSGPRTRISSHHPPALMRGELTPSISRHAAIRAHRNCGTADRSWIPPAAHARQPDSPAIERDNFDGNTGKYDRIETLSTHTCQPWSPFSTPLIQSPPNLPLQYFRLPVCSSHKPHPATRNNPSPFTPVTRRLSGTVAMSHQGEISRPCCP